MSKSTPSWSSHLPVPLSNFTISPTSGPGMPSKFMFGAGSPPGNRRSAPHGDAAAPPSHTAPSLMLVVWFPDWNTAAYTVFPSALRASGACHRRARGWRWESR